VVEKLLGLARTEAGDAAIVPAPVALRSLADNVVAWLEPLAQERAITVTVAGEPVDVAGDAGALFEAINNLVTNAILYNRPGGGVTISVDKDGRSARLSVADTGVGIPSAAMPYVFDRFFRVDQARGRDTGGAGLGLSVARAIIDRHGGTISCASQEGSGSVFAVNLPLS
jgi:signal transduction histidine kinase